MHNLKVAHYLKILHIMHREGNEAILVKDAAFILEALVARINRAGP